jgi:hypothetical protein
MGVERVGRPLTHSKLGTVTAADTNLLVFGPFQMITFNSVSPGGMHQLGRHV